MNKPKIPSGDAYVNRKVVKIRTPATSLVPGQQR